MKRKPARKTNRALSAATPPSNSELLFYQTDDGSTHLQVRLERDTLWLSQAQMAELFQTSVANINIHLRNLFAEKELQADSVIKDYLITAADLGKALKGGGQFVPSLDLKFAMGEGC